MRIAMLHPSLAWRGGAERQILILATELQQKGHDVEIFTCDRNEKCFPELASKLKINVIKVPFIQISPSSTQKRTFGTRLAGRFRGYMTEFPSMVYLAKKIPKGFDVINNHNAPTEWAAFFAKRKIGVPIVWNCNEPPFWYSDPKKRSGLGKINLPLYELFDRTTVDYIDTIVSNSSSDSFRIQKAYGRSSEIVRPGITLDLFLKASGKGVRAKYGLEKDFVLLQVANIARDKKQADSIMALYYLIKKFYNLKLVLVGQGPRGELIDLCKRLGVEDKVVFLQDCSDEELANIYAACDVFVFPAEITWGLAVIEAMANAKPVVVSKKAGVSEILRHAENGFTFDEPNPQNMASLIENLIVNPDLVRKVGISAHEYVKDNLTWKVYAQKMEVIFKKTIAQYH